MEQRISPLERCHLIMDWTEMMAEDSVEGRCARIAKWLKRYGHLQGVAFSLQDPRLDRTIVYTETIPEDVLQNLEDILPKLSEAENTTDVTEFMILSGGKLSVTNEPRDYQSTMQAVLAEPLATEAHAIGALALVGKANTINSLLDEQGKSSWVGPLISRLLDNSISHEVKDKKIRMLNLYQTISSSLAYVGDLYELLTTIMTVVTSELHCEEGSVLFHDEDSNEFEFFTAVGATAEELKTMRFPADKGIAGKALKERTTVVVNDVQTSPLFYRSIDEEHDFKTESILAAPLISGEEVVGVIEAINKLGNKRFDKEDAQILSAIADEVALAVKHARLFDYVVNSYCKVRQGQGSCKGCERPLKSWTPCVIHLEQQAGGS